MSLNATTVHHLTFARLDADPAADLSPLATAARQAGLDEPEITRTLDSARRTRQVHHQAEGMS